MGLLSLPKKEIFDKILKEAEKIRKIADELFEELSDEDRILFEDLLALLQLCEINIEKEVKRTKKKKVEKK